MIDCGFPIIEYDLNSSALERGRQHGESFRDAIAELAEIRTVLLREKNPNLSPDVISRLADQQWNATREYDLELSDELQGICEGSGLSQMQLTILNNYTDFRDIQLAGEQGCSVVYINYGRPIAGQTWDMHGSAKNYVSVLRIPGPNGETETILFSLVGCLGMMGFSHHGTTLQVNNINTDGAVAAVMWPAIVRKTLQYSTHDQMTDHLTTARVTSGHNYLIASPDRAEMWEVMPGLADCADSIGGDKEGFLFHTNHCLGRQAQKRETQISQNSTTHIRYDLIDKKIGDVRDFQSMYELLNDHENYPKSICSNFQTDAQDPSITCGGAIGDLTSGKIVMWRGDQIHDQNFVRHDFELNMVN